MIAAVPARSALALALGAALLAGCQTVEKTLGDINPFDHSPNIETTVFARISADDGLNVDGSRIDPAVAASSGYTAARAAADTEATAEDMEGAQPELIPYGQGLDASYSERFGTIDLPAAEEKLNALLGRIQQLSPVLAVPARVYIEPHREFVARAEREGAIMISLGALKKAENDADIVFLLAHEYAHLALGHFEDAEAQQGMRRMAEAAGQMLLLRTAFDSDEDAGDLERALRYPRGISMLTESLFWRGWNQHDEMEADLFAADVLAAMDMHPRNAGQAIAKIADGEMEPLKLPIFNENSMNLGLAALLEGENSAAKEELTKQLAASAFVAVDRVMREAAGETHPDGDTRQDMIGEYADKHYKNMPLGLVPATRLEEITTDATVAGWLERLESIRLAWNAMESEGAPEADRNDRAVQFMYDVTRGDAELDVFARFQFANVRARMGHMDKAIENLELGFRDKERVPFVMYRELAHRRLDAKDVPGARAAVSESLKAYPEKENELLPLRIRIAAQAGDPQTGKTHHDSCKRTSLHSLIVACDAAWQKYVVDPALTS